MARNCLQAGHVNTLAQPSRSPYLSPNEELWDIPGWRVCYLYRFPAATLTKLERWLKNGIAFYREVYADLSLLSKDNRLTECITECGGHIRY